MAAMSNKRVGPRGLFSAERICRLRVSKPRASKISELSTCHRQMPKMIEVNNKLAKTFQFQWLFTTHNWPVMLKELAEDWVWWSSGCRHPTILHPIQLPITSLLRLSASGFFAPRDTSYQSEPLVSIYVNVKKIKEKVGEKQHNYIIFFTDILNSGNVPSGMLGELNKVSGVTFCCWE